MGDERQIHAQRLWSRQIVVAALIDQRRGVPPGYMSMILRSENSSEGCGLGSASGAKLAGLMQPETTADRAPRQQSANARAWGLHRGNGRGHSSRPSAWTLLARLYAPQDPTRLEGDQGMGRIDRTMGWFVATWPWRRPMGELLRAVPAQRSLTRMPNSGAAASLMAPSRTRWRTRDWS